MNKTPIRNPLTVKETADVVRRDKQGQPSVLVAESDPDMRRIFQKIFERIGLSRQVVVGTGEEAIKSCGRRNSI